MRFLFIHPHSNNTLLLSTYRYIILISTMHYSKVVLVSRSSLNLIEKQVPLHGKILTRIYSQIHNIHIYVYYNNRTIHIQYSWHYQGVANLIIAEPSSFFAGSWINIKYNYTCLTYLLVLIGNNNVLTVLYMHLWKRFERSRYRLLITALVLTIVWFTSGI